MRSPSKPSFVLTLAALAALLAPPAGVSSAATEVRDGDAYVAVDLTAKRVTIGTAAATRAYAWDAAGFRTVSLRDVRTGREWAPPEGSNVFTYARGPLVVTSAGWTAVPTSVAATTMSRGGVAVRLRLVNPLYPGVEVTRRVEALPGAAGFATRTTLRSVLPLTFDSMTLDEITVRGEGHVAHGVDMRGGADWRDNTGYDYRADVGPAPTIRDTAEWMDVITPAGDGLALLMERRNYHSSVMSFDGRRAAAVVDTSRDLAYLGPIEPGSAGVNPAPVARYVRSVPAGGELDLEPAYLALGTDADDLPWQAYRYLRHRMTWTGPTIDFNTDKVDKGAAGRGRGAKDDADFQTVMQLLPIVERLGAEVFVLDDGWMPRNGDWYPDPDRFPDGFEPLVAQLQRRGMRLGLWMAPANFHPNAATFRSNPEWSCAPVGTAVGAANAADPEGDRVTGSAEPGVGFWNMLGINRSGEVFADHLRDDIERLVTRYGVAKFKYDFLLWLDCLGPQAADVYQYHDAFLHRVIDPLARAHPEVGFGVDETNDYRAFPYESILRGPTWFQNGTPGPDVLLHNVWTLAPYVPGFTLGQHVLGGDSTSRYPVDYLVAVSMTYQPTIWKDVRDLVDADGASKLDARGQPVIETARRWFDFFKARRGALAGFSYPLLSDPLGGRGWAAMQPWDRDAQRGFVQAFRQDADEAERAVPLRGLDASRTYTLTDEVTGAPLGSASGADLMSSGITLTAQRFGFRIIRVEGSERAGAG